MISRRRALRALALAPALLARRSRAAPWVSPELADHPLVGTIWDARERRSATRATLEAACAQADFVLVGETHDNPDHHRLQLELLEAIVRAGRRPAVALEQFDREHQAALDRARTERPGDAGSVADAAQFDRRGWHWTFYEPMVAFALRNDLPLVAANLSRRDAVAVVERGYDALGRDLSGRLGLSQPLGAALAQAMEAVVREGHCGNLPESVVPRMVAAQRARDAVMADALLAQASAGAVLIAGNGHVRRDLGVPLQLAARAPRRGVLAVGIVEVVEGMARAEDYVAPAAGDAPQFDFVVFTPRTARPDPCARLAPRIGAAAQHRRSFMRLAWK
ncbi:MAG TPA: ChaN family lipoprotein [Burkholderiales bacterium]|nr:ChaN family lipoprotein [Burkholderiales bacterium]